MLKNDKISKEIYYQLLDLSYQIESKLKCILLKLISGDLNLILKTELKTHNSKIFNDEKSKNSKIMYILKKIEIHGNNIEKLNFASINSIVIIINFEKLVFIHFSFSKTYQLQFIKNNLNTIRLLRNFLSHPACKFLPTDSEILNYVYPRNNQNKTINSLINKLKRIILILESI